MNTIRTIGAILIATMLTTLAPGAAAREDPVGVSQIVVGHDPQFSTGQTLLTCSGGPGTTCTTTISWSGYLYVDFEGSSCGPDSFLQCNDFTGTIVYTWRDLGTGRIDEWRMGFYKGVNTGYGKPIGDGYFDTSNGELTISVGPAYLNGYSGLVIAQPSGTFYGWAMGTYS